jgi:hypothetical protein
MAGTQSSRPKLATNPNTRTCATRTRISINVDFAEGRLVACERIAGVWPCAGMALAAILGVGYHLWPAIFVGAFH